MKFIKPEKQAEILENSKEVEFINNQYIQKYFTIPKIWNFKTIIIGRDISKLSRGGIYKTSAHAEILQNS